MLSVVIINGGGAMLIKKLAGEEEPGVESVTVTKKGKVPAVVGVPEMVPLLGVRASPGGKAPLVIVQFGVPVTGTAVSMAKYDTFTCPLGNADPTIIGAAMTGLARDVIPIKVTSKRINIKRIAQEYLGSGKMFFCRLPADFITLY
jgi:hypothetical protein